MSSRNDKLPDTDFHSSAKALLVEAAEQSGLLREIAELLWFASKHEQPPGWCPQCELFERLADAFDDHTTLPDTVGEAVFGGGIEGLDTSPGPDEAHEVDAFIG